MGWVNNHKSYGSEQSLMSKTESVELEKSSRSQKKVTLSVHQLFGLLLIIYLRIVFWACFNEICFAALVWCNALNIAKFGVFSKDALSKLRLTETNIAPLHLLPHFSVIEEHVDEEMTPSRTGSVKNYHQEIIACQAHGMKLQSTT